MAVVGEAHIIVKAITSGVERDIRNGFQNVEGAGTDAGQRLGKSYGNGFWSGYNSSKGAKVFDKIRDGLRSLDGEASRSLQTFQRLATANYFVSGAMGVLAGTIGQAVVGLGALVGAAIGAASSLVAVGSAAISAKIGFSTIGFAMKGISQAVSAATSANNAYGDSLRKAKFDAEDAALAIDEAGLTLEKAIEARNRVADLAPNDRRRREADLNVKKAELALRKAKDAEKNAGKPTGAAGADPYAGLTPSQKDFAKYLVGIRGKLDELREEVAKGFLPKLKTAIDSMLKTTFPTFKVGLRKIAESMGDAAIEFSKAFDNKQVQTDLETFFANVATNVKPLGRILSSLSIGLIRFLNAAQPITEKFVNWVADIADSFKEWTLKDSGKITDFLNTAGDAAAILGDIFKNVFKGLGDIIYENIKPGSGGYELLVWIREATGKFAEIGKTEGFSEIFKEAAKGTKALLQVIGKVIGFFLQFAGDPNVTKFWETIRDGFPSMEKVVGAISDALPSIAEFINEIGGIFAALGETDGLKKFFETLRDIAKAAKDVIKFLAPLLAFLAPILAVVAAFRLFGKVLKFLGLTGLGLTNKFKSFLDIIKKVFGIFNKGNKDAKKGQKEVGDSVDRTEKNVRRMNKAVSATESAFKKMNTAIGNVNKSLTTFKDRINNALNPLSRLKTSSEKAVTQIKGLKTEGEKAAGKLTKIKSEGDKAQKSLDKVKTAAQKARAELKLLGSTKSNPTIGSRTPAGAGAQGGGNGGGGGGTTILPGGMGKLSGLAKGGLIAGTIMVGGQALIEGGNNLAEVANKAFSAEKALSLLAQVNGGLGASAKNVGKDLVDLAFSQSQVTGVSADQYIEVEKLLMKYPYLAKTSGDVNGKFRDLVKSSADVAYAIGTDAPTAAQIMADALKNPETAIEDLTAAGIIFNDAEKKKYDSILQTNGAAAAQEYAIGRINGKYTDMAKNSTTTADKVTANWAKIGKKVSDFFKPIMDFINSVGLGITELILGVTGEKNKTTTQLTNAANKGYIGYYPGGGAGGRKNGGYIGFDQGGYVSGPGTARSDSISAMLSNGEFVVNSRATAQNRGLLEAINSNKSVASAPNIYVTVNPSAKMNEKELASEVSRQLAFQIRRGGM